MDLVARVKGILLSPKSEWEVIDGESTTVSALYTGYIMPLAAIPAIAGFIGSSILGYSLLGTSYKLSITIGLEAAIVRYCGSLVMTYVLALIIDALAPTFGGEKNQIQALKVAAYSSTAFWVAGIFSIMTLLSILSLLGFYSLYLLYVGLPRLMKAPQEKAMGYTVIVIVCAIVIGIVIATITRAMGFSAMGMTR